jgi:hypothetical protein
MEGEMPSRHKEAVMTYSMLFFLWVAITAAVAVLLVWHILVAKKEFLRISPEDSRVVEEEVKLGGTLKRIEFWGKTLTATSAAMAVIAGAVFVYHLLAV